jgi:ribonuclease HII
MKYIVGVDEAGRGPLAGPVSVGVVVVRQGFDFTVFKKLRDSKKLSVKKRKEFFALIKQMHKHKKLSFAVSLVSEKIIDTKGISFAIRKGVEQNFKKLSISKHTDVYLDGSLKAPADFKNQETIIKGDEKIPVISLASICAKVTRDEYMVKMAKKYPEYGFDIHKGYGTRKHYQCIKKYGVSTVHRKSFCKGLK